MLFDLRPKERLNDLFGRRAEYGELSRLVRSGQWVAVLGRRRDLYTAALRMLRHGARWSELRDELGVNEKVLRDILSSLEGAGLIAREGGLYIVADPIVREAAARLRPRGGRSAP